MPTALAIALAALTACSARPYAMPVPGDCLCEEDSQGKCDPRDGICKCGPVENGLVCARGSVCTAQGANEYTCVSSRCELVSCDRGMACDPDTGSCTCEGKTCAADQRCQAGRCVTSSCKGGPCPCAGVRCDLNFPGSTCDPADGFCRCLGERCDLGDLCVTARLGPTCATPCDPLAPSCSGCYLDASLGMAGCLAPGAAREGALCTRVNDCLPGLDCLPSSGASVCTRLCDPRARTSCLKGETCAPLQAAAGLGTCARSP